MKRTIIAGLIAVLAVAGCQKHSDTNNASPSTPSAPPTSASPSTAPFSIADVQRRIAAQIELSSPELIAGRTYARCPEITDISQTKTFDCTVAAQVYPDAQSRALDETATANGTANITLTDATGATFSMHYELYVFMGVGVPSTKIDGDVPSVK